MWCVQGTHLQVLVGDSQSRIAIRTLTELSLGRGERIASITVRQVNVKDSDRRACGMRLLETLPSVVLSER